MRFKEFLEFRWKYLGVLLLKQFIRRKSKNPEYLYVTHDEGIDWILGAKARRLCANSKLQSRVYYSHNFKKIPDAQGYYFLHQKYFARALRYNPHLLKRKLIVMFTHPEWNKWYSPKHMKYALGFADKIICLNSAVLNELQQMGIDKEKLEVYHMASDPNVFLPKERRGDGVIGFSMAFGPRKNPEVVAGLIKAVPDRKFILIGPRWSEFLEQKGIINAENLTYYDQIPYEDYPGLYHRMDVLVSPSILEGGPVPVLEAMLCNVVPVASRTGFCADIIEHGKNGYLFDIDASVDEISELIEKAYTLKDNVRAGIEEHSWENYGERIGKLFTALP